MADCCVPQCLVVLWKPSNCMFGFSVCRQDVFLVVCICCYSAVIVSETFVFVELFADHLCLNERADV